MSKLVAVKYKHHSPGRMTIDWYVGKRCNFSCSYCADFIHDNYSAHVPFEKMKIFVDKIVSIYKTNIHWSLTGGEPTLNPDFLKLVEYLQDKKHDVSVCTNGSRSLDYLYEMYKFVDTIVLSLHFEHISSKLDSYVDKAIALEKWRLNWNKNIPSDKKGWDTGKIMPKQFLLRFMVVPGFANEIDDLTKKLNPIIEKVEHRVVRPQKDDFLKDNKTKTEKGFYKWKIKNKETQVSSSTKVSPNKDNVSSTTEITKRERRWYSEKDHKSLQDLYKNVKDNRKWLIGFKDEGDGKITQEEYHYNDLNYKYKTCFTGWTCHAGVGLLKIAPNGDIFIGNCFQGGSLGNIYSLDEKFQPPTKPVICKKFRCTDPLDLRQPKYIEEKYKRLFE